MHTRFVEFFYDIRSPYAYFAWKKRHHLEKEKIEFTLSPVSVDGLLNLPANRGIWDAYEDPLCAQKRSHLMKDIARLSRFWNIKIGSPFGFKPSSTKLMALLAILKLESEAQEKLLDRAFDDLWMHAIDIDDTDYVLKLLRELEIDSGSLESLDTGNEHLASATQRAFERGVFGVPSFIMKNEIYFGADRVDLMVSGQ